MSLIWGTGITSVGLSDGTAIPANPRTVMRAGASIAASSGSSSVMHPSLARSDLAGPAALSRTGHERPVVNRTSKSADPFGSEDPEAVPRPAQIHPIVEDYKQFHLIQLAAVNW
jgi:hypothetical protein